MWPLLIWYLGLIVLIVLAFRHASKLDAFGEKVIYLLGAFIYKLNYNRQLKHKAPRHRLPTLGRGYVSVPKNEEEFRAFFLHEVEFQLDIQLQFTADGAVKLSGAQRRMLENYIQQRDLPYASADQAFSDVGLKLVA
jgi:hypothetical protein